MLFDWVLFLAILALRFDLLDIVDGGGLLNLGRWSAVGQKSFLTLLPLLLLYRLNYFYWGF